ncbi:VCBS repeat-containing protein [Aliifodinibius sp. S!AR15-10]|uniref:VCBS repeat-containing protein n=1 Tax=Aliifodinibius sp. S!AR15-10 TaxID=2950437 RepID=UPI00285BA2EC|nr:VCBS repeat-containing protein [Aliifodinibius sp. S!AR15-10]MDR8392511.1 VCBS repeat-containing protein [Aliifodinibius sp. S!AR15-10]
MKYYVARTPFSSTPFGNFPKFVLSIMLFLAGCTVEKPKRFETLPVDQTNVTFSNDLETTSEFNILNYLYFYDGGGVSIGDINNDGLSDLYFTANMKPNRLYLNNGDFQFEDITAQAGVEGGGDWTTGTTMVDINADGLLDIYVNNVNYLTKEGRNQLFINNGDSTFTNMAEEYGLDFQGYSKHATFFDYDNDGDLDLYLLNHAVHTQESFARADRRKVNDANAGDRLYRNDGGTFTNVTEQAGIYNSILGYGLAATASDLNNDGCTDIYVSNDFHENDYLYQNNCDGTFAEVLERSTGHTSRASMGNDIADINNDGLADIYVTDMLPNTEEGLKTAVSSETFKVYTIQRQFGYHPQLVQNTLQLNRGEGPDSLTKFSEIAQYAGVNATDWSWAPLFFDMDNDGYKDLYVTNGIYRRPNNLDYLLYVRQDTTQESLSRGRGSGDIDAIERMPHTKVPNVGFRNNGDYTFSDESSSLGFDTPSYSNGAAYGDLDNDGDLDLVTNNLNSMATIQRNMTREREGGNYLQISFEGEGQNTKGIGSKLVVYDSTSLQKYEMFTTRGFQSSVEPRLTVGLGSSKEVDSLTVIWPDGRWQTLRQVSPNQSMVLKQADAAGSYNYNARRSGDSTPLFEEVSSQVGPDYRHREDTYLDFNQQQLAPFMLSSQGPGIAVGDLNGDGLEDLYVGGAKRQGGKLIIQQEDGTFQVKEVPSFEHYSQFEDVDAELFDANGDGTLDLYIVSGGNEFSYQTEGLRDRFYFNDQNENFVRVADAFPEVLENGSVAKAKDYDGDGDMDLFVGSRSIPHNYGISPDSHLFENQGNGKFEEVTDEVAPALRQLGMVTDAKWSDIDLNGTPDLVISGEWMPLVILYNRGGKFVRASEEAGLKDTNGWWQSVETGDFDSDGDIDLVAGNMGTNSFRKASDENPIVMYLKDFNDDGQIDPIIGYTQEGAEYPVAPRDELLTQFKFLRPKFNSYQDYAGKTIQQIFGETLTEGDWEKKTVMTLKSAYIENQGDGSFEVHPFPTKTQWAPIFDFSVNDYNNDGNVDLLTGGNMFDVKPSMGGRFDAGYGLYLKGNGDGTFSEIEMQESGFSVGGEIRDIRNLRRADGGQLIIVARNDKPLLIYTFGHKGTNAFKAGSKTK